MIQWCQGRNQRSSFSQEAEPERRCRRLFSGLFPIVCPTFFFYNIQDYPTKWWHYSLWNRRTHKKHQLRTFTRDVPIGSSCGGVFLIKIFSSQRHVGLHSLIKINQHTIYHKKTTQIHEIVFKISYIFTFEISL